MTDDLNDDLKVVARHKEAGYTFVLYNDGSYVVTHPSVGIMDEGTATMGAVHADDVATYFDTWHEELRCMMAQFKRFG